MEKSTDQLREMARNIRCHALNMVHSSNSSHIGTCLSMADILAVLYGSVLNLRPREPSWSGRDRFILSKGHGAAGLYGTLCEAGFIEAEALESYCQDGSPYMGHVNHKGIPGVEASTGSLGHGLSIASGIALAAKADGAAYRAFCILGDGECDEGSVWEAALFAPHHRLDNLVAIIDYNQIQSFGRIEEVLDLHPLAEKWQAFGWHVISLDGHDIAALVEALSAVPAHPDKPTAIIARTVKGKGVHFMENELLWHYRSPDDQQLAQALAEVRGADA